MENRNTVRLLNIHIDVLDLKFYLEVGVVHLYEQTSFAHGSVPPLLNILFSGISQSTPLTLATLLPF